MCDIPCGRLGLVMSPEKTSLTTQLSQSQQKLSDLAALFRTGSARAAYDATARNDIPGIIVLNSGQLVYSHQLKKNVSEKGFLAQPRKDALEEQAAIDDKWNRVPGHKNPQEHVNTMLERVIPKLTNSGVRIWLIGVSDGAENLIQYMDGRLSKDDLKMIIPSRTVKAMALMHPTHNADQVSLPLRTRPSVGQLTLSLLAQVKSELAKLKLSARAKCWVISDETSGTVLATAPTAAAHARDYEGAVYSDPIPVPKPIRRAKVEARRMSELTALHGSPGHSPDSKSPYANANYRRGRAVTLGSGQLSVHTPGIPLPPMFGNILPLSPKIPRLDPTTVKPPSDGSEDESPTDPKKPSALQEHENRQKERKERLRKLGLAKDANSPSYLDQNAIETFAPGEVTQIRKQGELARKSAKLRAGGDNKDAKKMSVIEEAEHTHRESDPNAYARYIRETILNNPHAMHALTIGTRQNWPTSDTNSENVDFTPSSSLPDRTLKGRDACMMPNNANFGDSAGVHYARAEGISPVPRGGPDPFMLRSALNDHLLRYGGELGERAARGESVASSRGEGDPAVYSASEYSDQASEHSEEQQPALLKGGDYDNDEGMWMKPYKSDSSTEPQKKKEMGERDAMQQAARLGKTPGTYPDVDDEEFGGVQLETPVSETASSISDYASATSHQPNLGENNTDVESNGNGRADSETMADSAVGSDDDALALVSQDADDTGTGNAAHDNAQMGEMLTVSSGVDDLIELIFPAVMDDVLAWFVEMSHKSEY